MTVTPTDKPALHELPDSKLFDHDPELLCTPEYAREVLKRIDAAVLRQRKARASIAQRQTEG